MDSVGLQVGEREDWGEEEGEEGGGREDTPLSLSQGKGGKGGREVQGKGDSLPKKWEV